MTQTLTAVAVQFFDAEVKHAYQTGGKLRRHVKYKTNMQADTFNFPKIGKGMAKQHVPLTKVQPMGVVHSKVQASPSDWNAADYTSIFTQAKTNVEERKELAVAIAMAVERREDQLILDVLDAATPGTTVAESVGGANTDLNPAKIKQAQRKLGDKGVPEGPGERAFVSSFQGREALLGATEVTSRDYNNVLALTNGEVKTWLGFDFEWIETRDEGGLKKVGNLRANYAFHRTAAGLGTVIDSGTTVDWIPDMRAHLSCQDFSAGAVVIDTDGFCEVTTYES